MNTITTTLLSGCLAFAVGGAFAQDAAKNDSMAKTGMTNNEMTLQQCKDHMAMSKKAGAERGDAMMAKDKTCADMMKKDSTMKKSNTMKKEPSTSKGMEPTIPATPNK